MKNRETRSRWGFINIVAVVLGFIVWWPIGLAIIAYTVWGPQKDLTSAEKDKSPVGDLYGKWSGSSPFDDYRVTALKRLESQRRKLEDEEAAFDAFLDRLRHARNRQEFDQFLAEQPKL